jgi:mitogen-activated protein kinase 8 interacting protein 1
MQQIQFEIQTEVKLLSRFRLSLQRKSLQTWFFASQTTVSSVINSIFPAISSRIFCFFTQSSRFPIQPATHPLTQLLFQSTSLSFKINNKSSLSFPTISASLSYLFQQQTSLADEMGSQTSLGSSHQPFKQNSLLAFKCSYLLDEDSSPDSEKMHSLGDVDSGHSTAHSPNDFKSITPPNAQASPQSHSPFPPAFGGVPYSQLEMLEATHRGLHKFLPRHHDELEIEIGDPIYVQKEADDLWCEGVNLRTGNQGVFPSAYAVDLEYNDFDPASVEQKRERYLLGYLGSVETLSHKGTGVVCQAVRKIVGDGGEMTPKGTPCILEISDQGLRMVDRSKVSWMIASISTLILSQLPEKTRTRTMHRLLLLAEKRFILCFSSSRPSLHWIHHETSDDAEIRLSRFRGQRLNSSRCWSCRVSCQLESFRQIAMFIVVFLFSTFRRAFQRFYQKFIETAYPTEDIYMEN